jgi:hydrogenase/urease accessory protein HupE
MKRWAGVVTLCCVLPPAAQAHLVSTGFGSYYDGMAHLVMTPGDLLPVIGLGLLAGLGGAAAGRTVLVVLPMAWLVGGLVGIHWPGGGELSVLLVLSFGVMGGLVALDCRLPQAAVLALAGGAGLLHGYINGTTMTAGGQTWLALLGAATAVFVVATLLPALVVSLRQQWMRVAVRVAGSWLAAISPS